MTTLHLRKSSGRSPLRLGFLLIPLVPACFALALAARAQLPSPTPDGGYPGANTAEGDGALFNLDLSQGFGNTATGFAALYFNNANNNTATGYQALSSNTTGTFNTASGCNALQLNQTGSNNTATGGGGPS